MQSCSSHLSPRTEWTESPAPPAGAEPWLECPERGPRLPGEAQSETVLSARKDCLQVCVNNNNNNNNNNTDGLLCEKSCCCSRRRCEAREGSCRVASRTRRDTRRCLQCSDTRGWRWSNPRNRTCRRRGRSRSQGCSDWSTNTWDSSIREKLQRCRGRPRGRGSEDRGTLSTLLPGTPSWRNLVSLA